MACANSASNPINGALGTGHWAGLHTDHTGAGNMSDLDKSMDKMIPIFGTHMDGYTKNMAIHIS